MIKRIAGHVAEKKIYRDLLLTVIIGAIAATIDILTLNIFYRFIHVNIYLATLIGFLTGTVFGYPANNYWTYRRHNQKAHIVGLLKSVTVASVGLLITEIAMYILSDRLGYNYNIAKLVAIFCVFFWNFFGNRLWTFRAKSSV